MLIEGVPFNVQKTLPGLINAHDHMEFALFPQLGNGPYANASDWVRDIYRPDASPIAEQLRIPKHLRLRWGGLRNLLAGVTTVCEHNPYHGVFDDNFPVRVVKRYGWAHSLEYGSDIADQYRATPPEAPFLIHAGEGTDDAARAEIFELDRLGVLGPNTVLVHSVAWDAAGWALLQQRGVNIISCPRSNLFTLGQTLSRTEDVALGTDSPLTAEGDLLDEIAYAQRHWEDVPSMVTTNAARILRLAPQPLDFIAAERFGAPPDLVVINGELRLISLPLAEQLTASQRCAFSQIEMQGRPPVLVRLDVPGLLAETKRYFDGPLRLAGREFTC